jgi:hypothetical protein
MKRSFSFNSAPAQLIVEAIHSFLPGIEKVVGIYFNHVGGGLNGILLQNAPAGIETEQLHPEDPHNHIAKMRGETIPFAWLGKEDVPFEIYLKEKVQLNIFNEFNNNILLIRLNNEHDHLSDLYFIYFSPNIDKQGIVNFNKPLSPENKTIIGQIVRNALLAIMDMTGSDREIFSDLTEYTRIYRRETDELRAELEKTKEKAKETIIRLCYSYLSELSLKNHCNYSLTENASLKLKDFEGEPVSLKVILEKAVNYAATLDPDPLRRDIRIDDHHIVLKDYKEQAPEARVTEPLGTVDERYRRTVHLLDRLEAAASTLKARNQLLTSRNIGDTMETPVSPPAITDALKKHSRKIVHLFAEYPGRWQIIRTEFRPVQNMINTLSENQRLSA